MFRRGPKLISVSAFGVDFDIRVSRSALVESVRAILPPGYNEGGSGRVAASFSLESRTGYDGELFMVEQDTQTLATTASLDGALDVLDAAIRATVAHEAPDHIFVHAGVVAHHGRAIVLPGISFAGKSTLVAELVRQGAEYLSDEYAVLDASGVVQPYARALSIRSPTGAAPAVDVAAEDLGGVLGGPCRIGLIVKTRYSRGTTFEPETVPEGLGALVLMENTVPARSRPEQCLDYIARATSGSAVLSGDRGEASDAATWLLATRIGT